jgi:hypothetical protein
LAELNTQRVLSRNSSSSRAIPVSKMIEAAKTNPAMPVFWGKNQAGMQSNVELEGVELAEAKRLWLEARDNAVISVEKLAAVGLHKQCSNRILEPWLHTTSLVSGTDFENLFALRAHPDAQPEFRDLAYLMLELYQKSTPTKLKVGEWHIPFGDKIDEQRLIHDTLTETHGQLWWEVKDADFILEDAKLNIATARCARVSYLNFDGKDDYSADIKLTTERLAPSGHWSAFEHCARAMETSTQMGNFVGWKQYRKFFVDENRKDDRVRTF